MKQVIILGTSRSNGNTHKLVKLYQEYSPADIINLSDYSISPYDYEHKNIDDDFANLIKNALNYDHIIFASPIYWYSMSAQMKIFFDRLSDLLTINKELGRRLRGKTCAILATGLEIKAPKCFEQPFILTANYLGMHYQQMFYCSCNEQFIVQKHLPPLISYLGMQSTYQ
ncbi:flavodoxin family protein [Thalassotalea piscium]|uniref:Multimeric flavodoxin WrbA n=1 Tax=Thalassotalea piscium TaxID=1230533 RepID=A0A7X0NIQ0_9GAMM|nr:flavodoxin family protein [Thalassotalea piscium]MBB6544026.1 multimeric flavodoxin WrbA [Thalassotalea piscium]